MAKTQENFGNLSKLALITDGLQNLFPDGKSVIIVELNIFDFEKMKNISGNIGVMENQFKLDISGLEVVFLQENTYRENKIEELKIEKTVKKSKTRGFFKKLFSKVSS